MTDVSGPDPRALLAALVRFPTVNPPGSERECVLYCRDVLAGTGIETRVLALDPDRPSLVARVAGRGDAPPLLLHGHVDVVPTEGQAWSVPPFEALERDGFVWGRGTLDDKASVAMMLAAAIRAHRGDPTPAGDVILAIVPDEEAGGRLGAGFLVDDHPDLFDGVRFALGEAGGFTFHLGGRRLYPIQVAEKQTCRLTVTFRGTPGHASFRHRDAAPARLGRALVTLDRRRLPVHVVPSVRLMIDAIADALPAPRGTVLRRLRTPALTDRILDLMGPRLGGTIDPLLHDTVSPVVVRAGDRHNVIPGIAELVLDGRVLPGRGADDLVREVRALLGPDAEVRVDDFQPYPGALDMGLFDVLAGSLRIGDPGGVPVPYVTMASTDARHFARLGIQTYGFTPMRLPAGYAFATMAHGADERIPVDAVGWGTAALSRVLATFGGGRARPA
ncbi:MAG: M20/M25/M40 family metallo-hydrolase [Chloroflexi bacterium]|jgi:acetylornithine deacetylase/succinyl-diaminopimelate desuccinylase-like protein|nr:M20/M25/M40 family metallo-hydrolase [Chloroflexota bacterium]